MACSDESFHYVMSSSDSCTFASDALEGDAMPLLERSSHPDEHWNSAFPKLRRISVLVRIVWASYLLIRTEIN